MELYELLTRYFNIKKTYSNLSSNYFGLRYRVENLKNDVIRIARKMMKTGVKAMNRKKIIVQLDDGAYAKITHKEIWICYRYGKETCHRIDCYCFSESEREKYVLDLMRKLSSSGFVFANEMGELLETYHALDSMYRKLSRESYYERVDCHVYIGDKLERAVIEGVKASYTDGLDMLVPDTYGHRRFDVNYDEIAISIAYNCYEHFMNILNELSKYYDSHYKEVRKFEEKIDEYYALMKTFKAVGGEDD